MKSKLIIFFLAFYCIVVSGQESCLPEYSLPVKTIQLSFGKLAYVEKGKGETLLFIHGLGGNLSHWIKSVNALSKYFNCIAIDLPGYGWSDVNRDSLKQDILQFYSNIIDEFLDKKKIGEIALIGHSMGGQIATINALQNNKVKNLILVAPAGLETFSEQEGQILIKSTPAIVFEKQAEPIIRYNFKVNFVEQPIDVEQLIQDRLKLKSCNYFKEYCETVSAGIKGMLLHPIKDSLSLLKMPVCILFGAQDALIPNRYLHPTLTSLELTNEASKLISNCKVEFIENAGHLVQYEKNNETNISIQNFIKSTIINKH